jgi:hypothetical protein
MDVAPSAPLDRVHWEEGLGALLLIQRVEKVFGGLFNGRRWHAGLFDREKTGDHNSVGGNSLKGFCRRGQGFLEVAGRAASGV